MCLQRNEANQKKIKFEAYFDDGCEDLIISDQQRIMQVLLGLQSNAMKFTQRGHILIMVSTETVSSGNCYLNIKIEDTGIGIAKKDQGKLFKLFGFVQDSQQVNTKGIGLGLLIAKQIVRKFDGKISFQSEKGVGTTFQFTFKLSQPGDITEGRVEENKGLPCVNSSSLEFKWLPRHQGTVWNIPVADHSRSRPNSNIMNIRTHNESHGMHEVRYVHNLNSLQQHVCRRQSEQLAL